MRSGRSAVEQFSVWVHGFGVYGLAMSGVLGMWTPSNDALACIHAVDEIGKRFLHFGSFKITQQYAARKNS